MFKTIMENARQTAHEISEMERLFSAENKQLREIVVYAERDISWQYYVDFIEYILAHSDKRICYLSSDLNDPIFKTAESRIQPFFIKNTLSAVFEKLDARVLIMTTPDLNKGAVKRAPHPVQHVYAFHGISSIHQGYRLGALDNYDTLLCIAQYQIDEVRKTEAVYNLTAKKLPLVGYPLVERIYRDHQQFIAKREGQQDEKQICLVAPTWDPQQKSSIMDACIDEMIEPLARSPFKVWLRPHPEFVKRFPKKIEAIGKRIQKLPNITLAMELGSMQCLHEADVLVTDHSTIAMDYVIGTERPVLYIDTPTRIDNPERDRLNMEVMENKIRAQMGATLAPKEVKNIGAVLETLIASQADFKERVGELRDCLVANWQQAAKIGGDVILGLCEK